MSVISGIVQHLRRLAGGANGAPATLLAGQIFSNENESVIYIGTGNNGSGVSTGQLKVGGIGAFHGKGRTAVSDANYTILATDVRVVLASITASRTFTLPAASAFDAKADLMIYDESGALSSSLVLTIAAAGSDQISGLSSIDLSQPYQKILLHSNGSNLWTYK